MLIDTHCHLNDEKLRDDAQSIVDAFGANNLEAVLNVGYDMRSSEEAVRLATENERVYAAVGIHPDSSAKEASFENYERLTVLAQNPKVVAWGEIGMDYFYEDGVPRAFQKGAFVEQLEVAATVCLPVSIHMRDCYEDMLNILRQNRNFLMQGFVLHCYSASAEMVKDFDALGAYYSFGGAITFPNAKRNIEALKAVPLDRLLLETDCPYMTPVPHRGERNEPKYVNYVAQKAAEVLGKSKEEIEEITTANAKALFTRMGK